MVFGIAQSSNELVTVHFGHHYIGNYKIKVARLDLRERLATI